MTRLTDDSSLTWRAVRLLIVVAGVVLGQAILYGPSLVSSKILLPLDILSQPDFYLPIGPETENVVPHSSVFSDPVLSYELNRRFAASEIRALRFDSRPPGASRR